MHTTNFLTKIVRDSLLTLETKNICVAISGGIDSIVLCHILKHIDINIELTATHINHGISPNANIWADFCQQFCNKFNIPLQIESLNLKRLGGESLENIARIARYKILLKQIPAIIALAHHQNDQVETILSQLLRGSNLHNIAAMQIVSKKQERILWRPLLHISKAKIKEYAIEFGLDYINDESNLDTKYLRNFIRHDILPLLSAWDNNIITKILNFNHQLQSILATIDELAIEDLAFCCVDKLNIDLSKFKNLSNERQFNALCMFIKTNNLSLPSNRQLIEFVKQANTSSWDKQPQLNLNSKISLAKYKNSIYLCKNKQ